MPQTSSTTVAAPITITIPDTSVVGIAMDPNDQSMNKRHSRKASTIKIKKDSSNITSNTSYTNLNEYDQQTQQVVTSLGTPHSGNSRKSLAGNSMTEGSMKRKKKSIVDLPIKIRPTEPIRSGYLHKFDSQAAHAPAGTVGEADEDVWMNQFVSLDIATGLFVHYAEINGYINILIIFI